ncbi:MarC family protein [Microvirga zambiensis]|uniref:MarC family protein n=1 Tax=Microvirga zambiensis TaxID=1402137 RepID=UPI001FE8A391|nr:MarC family protein [Microvirga zambiensis]
MSQRYITELITLWVVIDPIGTLPVFLAVTAGMSAKAARRTALRATIAAFVVLLFFVVAGQVLLQAMEIDLDAFQIAGSVVLFLFALTMIFGEPKAEAEEKDLETSDVDRSIYPLAIPSIASPGAMLAVVSLTDNSKFSIAEQAETLVQMTMILSVTLVLMLLASRIIKIIGDAGASVISRVMGLILASVAVNGIVLGIKQAFNLAH